MPWALWSKDTHEAHIDMPKNQIMYKLKFKKYDLIIFLISVNNTDTPNV